MSQAKLGSLESLCAGRSERASSQNKNTFWWIKPGLVNSKYASTGYLCRCTRLGLYACHFGLLNYGAFAKNIEVVDKTSAYNVYLLVSLVNNSSRYD